MYAVKLTGTLRVSEEGELEGIDIHEHGAPAYHMEFGMGTSYITQHGAADLPPVRAPGRQSPRPDVAHLLASRADQPSRSTSVGQPIGDAGVDSKSGPQRQAAAAPVVAHGRAPGGSASGRLEADGRTPAM